MSFYRNHILPRLIHLAMGQHNLAAYRNCVMPAAEGRVLEIGIGSGLNLPFYTDQGELVIGLDSVCVQHSCAARSLLEMRRVLKPGGRFLFVEHGRSTDPKFRWWQDRLTRAWKRIGGGCHLNRVIGALIEGAGFRFERIETGYMRGPRPMTFMYEGSARPR